jgi:Family of unknown function (DUF6152)
MHQAGARATILRMKRWALKGFVAVAISGAGINAHHSLSGSYDTSREITVEGVVTVFQFVNPHPFVTISIEAQNGEKQLWRLEMDNRSELVEIGMSSGTLKPGDRVVVRGSPGRSDAKTIYIRRLDRSSDGLRYEQIGSTPTVQIPSKR